jgi:hypothetical protein
MACLRAEQQDCQHSLTEDEIKLAEEAVKR